MKKYLLEGFGTMTLVLVACGVAVLSGVNILTTSLAFGLVLFMLVLFIGPVSGCHVNPAVSFALALSKKISWKEFFFYVISQFIGGLVGSLLLFLLIGTQGTGANGFQTALFNGLKEGSVAPDFAVWIKAIAVEIFLTFIFVGIILIVTSKFKQKFVIALSIGLTLALVHLIGIGLTGTSVNPARSFGPAIVELINGNTDAIIVYPVFLFGPLVGGALAALVVKPLLKEDKEESCCCKKEECAEENNEEHCSCDCEK